MNQTVKHQEAEHRFVLQEAGQESELTYRRRGQTIIFDHTGVPPELQHRGLANELAEAGLQYAREHRLKVEPQCEFMAAYLQHHPEYQDLLDDAQHR